MTLSDAEKAMCKELGIEFGIPGFNQMKKVASDLKYAGFDTYVGSDGSVFEKLGEELVEVTSPEIEAQKRYLRSQRTLR